MVPAVIAFNFTPYFRIGDIVVRWETLALAVSIIVAVALAGLIAGRVGAVNESFPEMGGRERGAWHLRRDDLLFVLLGVVPGAVVGGRIGYVLIHWGYYSAHSGFILDPGQGSLELGFAVLFGTVAGVLVAFVLGAPIGRWLHVAIVPLLLGLTLGKLAMVLGGTGQGISTDVAWATAYLGPGPWGSLAPETPSHPAQVYEALLTLAVLILIGGLLLVGRFRDQDGRAFFAGISLWALGRTEAGFLWRDDVVLGPFRAGQLIALLIAMACFALFVVRVTYTGRTIREIMAARARIGRPATVMESGGRDSRLRDLDLPPMIPPSPTRPPAPAPSMAMSLERVRGRIASARAGATAARGWLASAPAPSADSDAATGSEAGLISGETGASGGVAGGWVPGLAGTRPRVRGAGIAAFAAATAISPAAIGSASGGAEGPVTELAPAVAQEPALAQEPAAVFSPPAGVREGEEVLVTAAALAPEAAPAERVEVVEPMVAAEAPIELVPAAWAPTVAEEPVPAEEPVEAPPAEEPAPAMDLGAPWRRRRLAPPPPPVRSGWLTPAAGLPTVRPSAPDDLAAAARHAGTAPIEPTPVQPPVQERPITRPQVAPPAPAVGSSWLRPGAPERAAVEAEAVGSAETPVEAGVSAIEPAARAPLGSPISYQLDREPLTSAPAATAGPVYDPLAASADLFAELPAPIAAASPAVVSLDAPSRTRDAAPTVPTVSRRPSPRMPVRPEPRGVPQETVAAADALVAAEINDPLAPRIDLFDVLPPTAVPAPVAAPPVEEPAGAVVPLEAVPGPGIEPEVVPVEFEETAAPEPEAVAAPTERSSRAVERVVEPEPEREQEAEAEAAPEAHVVSEPESAPEPKPQVETAAAAAVPVAPPQPTVAAETPFEPAVAETPFEPVFAPSEIAGPPRVRPAYRPPHRPVRPSRHDELEPAPPPVVAVDSTGRPLPPEPELRRRPHLPPRSRREFEMRLQAPEETEAAPPAWSARGRRLAEDAAAAERRGVVEEAARAAHREMERIEAARRRVARPALRRRPPAEDSRGTEEA